MHHDDQYIKGLYSSQVILADCCFLKEDGSEVAEEGLIDNWKLI